MKRPGRARAIGWLVAAAAGAYFLAIRPWQRRWGATEDEVRRPLPGDDLVPDPVFQSTRAVTIEAPVSAVWPWLVQLGYGRGGFYSYDWLEDLVVLLMGTRARYQSELVNESRQERRQRAAG